jgi:superfamily I DNA/RNA helicase
LGQRFSLREPLGSFTFTASGIEDAVQKIRANLDGIAREIRERQRSANEEERKAFPRISNDISKIRERLSSLREAELERIGKCYPNLLVKFYTSEIVKNEIVQMWGTDGWDKFTKHAEIRAEQRLFSRADRYFLLWLIHYMTRNSESTKGGVQPLPQYSHTVIDEAQYYHPLVLRMLVELAQAPLNSMTIVGDMEQKVNPEGLASWEEIGVPKTKFQFQTNYRWSQQVFQFLEIYRKEADLKVILRAPRQWTSGKGNQPQIVECDGEEAEVDWLIRQVTDLRRGDRSMAIVIPKSVEEPWRNRVIEELRGCDIRARWAEGQDVRECVEQVILTDYESIVGLEFDAVFLPRFEKVLSFPTADLDGRQAAWVALTRAKQFIGVSHVGKISIVSRDSFRPYRHAHPND